MELFVPGKNVSLSRRGAISGATEVNAAADVHLKLIANAVNCR